jgi:hypothetical protein
MRDVAFNAAGQITMAQIADINTTEKWILETTLKERYGEVMPYQLADADIRLHLSDREVTPCPVIYWEHKACHFVIFKTGDKKYRCQFFYKPYQQFNTGIYEYDDLAECAVSLLQAQADHDAAERGDIKQKRR